MELNAHQDEELFIAHQDAESMEKYREWSGMEDIFEKRTLSGEF